MRTVVHTALRGARLLTDPLLNAGTGFSAEERDSLGLHGLLPPVVETLDQQCVRAYQAYRRKEDDLERHIFLRQLQDANEILFYALLQRHIGEMTPVIYTPVVAEACKHFSQIYRRPRGLFISYPMRDRMEDMLRSRPHRNVDVAVVTDGERILGIGDQGAGGMGIPIGKLALYTLLGGIDPSRTLPVMLDVGTNNPELLRDPEYVGWRHERVDGQAYWDFVELFVQAVERNLPRVLLQWEDFASPHARPILDKYRGRLCTFNDDIQGTAAVVVGALSGALEATHRRFSDLEVVIAGAGSAGTGIAEYILEGMVAEGSRESDALSRFYLLDKDGLLHTGMTGLTEVQRKFAQPAERAAAWAGADERIDLAAVIRNTRASLLAGLTTQPGLFTEEIVREMASKVERPIIFPLSNPTERSEALPGDLVRWTDGRALIATGSPFTPVIHEGRRFEIGQCNNAYIFPAVGLSVAALGISRVTDSMMLAAARALGACSPARTDASAPLLPPLEGMRETSLRIAQAIGVEAQQIGLIEQSRDAELEAKIEDRFWVPHYPVYEPADP